MSEREKPMSKHFQYNVEIKKLAAPHILRQTFVFVLLILMNSLMNINIKKAGKFKQFEFTSITIWGCWNDPDVNWRC